MPTVTRTITAGEWQRLSTAMGAKLNLGRDATGAEVNADVDAYLRTIVLDQERLAAVKAQQSAAQPFTPT